MFSILLPVTLDNIRLGHSTVLGPEIDQCTYYNNDSQKPVKNHWEMSKEEEFDGINYH